MRSEKEKMLAGDFYNANDKELVREREYARELTFEFNNTRPGEKRKKEEILRRLIIAKCSCRRKSL
ncbi:hypothetical protein FYJ27_07190 [Anaerosalibacter bizertensis]|uniref:Maltose/galactoside acetyltransferase domain-containing protein n=1 Tax=Anaerosalibacter bizertensis TaxID=932217 RepID=A0A844FHR3_9FIRM|nr:maltose acetyltransferase domain-containing protein [Anaerosalibacter bizertensis]MSS43510.1 hypothetical protein [Anaerosalibacter bizertensis]